MSAVAVIRPATAADAGSLSALVGEYWAFEGIAGFDRIRTAKVLGEFFAGPGLGQAWIAERDGEAVGYLLACFVFSIEHGGLTAEIDEFFLKPGHRGSGLGRRLLEVAEAAFQAAGCTNVALQLGRGNDAGRAFYLRCGYSPRSGYELLDKNLASGRG